MGILLEAGRPTLLHYGSFEKTFLKKMCERYGRPPEPSAAATAIASATNLLAVIYARIYFPAYSNGLKEIARFLGFEWSDRSASGLLSISWRSRWEESRDAGLRDRLIAYNADDCEALSLVARTIVRLLSPEVPAGEQERKRGQTRNGRSGQAGAGGRRKRPSWPNPLPPALTAANAGGEKAGF